MERRYRALLLHNEYVDVGGESVPSLYAYRNGRTVLIDKVEVQPQTLHIQLELETLCRTAETVHGRPDVELVAVIDPPELLEADGHARDEGLMRRYRERAEYIRERASRVVDTAAGAETCAHGVAEELERISRAGQDRVISFFHQAVSLFRHRWPWAG